MMFEQLDDLQQDESTQPLAQCVCYVHEPFTFDRPALWIPIIIVMFAALFSIFFMADLSYGIQLGSLIAYTAFVALGTFSAQRGLQPFFFECSIVQQTIPRLLFRHCNFLVAIVLLETIALRLTRYMPASWLRSGKGGSPFAIALFIVCACMACVQMITNRSFLKRAHEESS